MSGERAYAALKELRDALAGMAPGLREENALDSIVVAWARGEAVLWGDDAMDRLSNALVATDQVLAAQLPLDLDPSASATLARLPVLHDSVISDAMQALEDEMDHDPEDAE